MSSIIFGYVATLLSLASAVGFGYLYLTDRDKRKLMFLIAFITGIFANAPRCIVDWEQIMILRKLTLWFPLLTLFALMIAVLSSLLEQKKFDRPFKVFLVALATIVFMVIIPFPVSPVPSVTYPFVSMTIIFVSFFLVLTRRELPDLMFLIATTALTSAEVGRNVIDSGVDLIISGYVLAHMFIFLVFVTSKENKNGGIASFFSLKKELEKTQEELRISQKKLVRVENIFAASPDAIVVTDLNGIILDCNNAALDMLGLSTKDEIIGKSGSTFIVKRDRDKIVQNMKNVLEIGSLSAVEYVVLDKNDYEFPIEISASTIKDPSGNPTGFVIIAKDIAERKMAEEALRKERETLERVTQNVGAGLGIISKDYRILWANNVLKGYHNDADLEGKFCYEILNRRDSPCPSCGVKEIFEKGESQVIREQLVPGFDGEDVWLELNSTAIRDENGNVTAALELVMPINKRKRMENELKRYSEGLEELVEERTRELQESQELLVRSERLAAIGQAATMVGHDLRNPLQAIENGVFYLNSELSNYQISEKMKETICAISESVEYADNIVNNLQSFTKEKKPMLAKIDVNEILKDVTLLVKKPDSVELIIEAEDLPKIEVDTEMVKQVFVNLTNNGIQAMKEKGGLLSISTRDANGFIEVIFKDTGVGISEENLAKIFTPFFTTKAQGMGVGLAICKRIIEQHNGSIKVESKLGEGSRFTVSLPIKRN